MKRIMVGNYTYETNLNLKVGDKVVLPTAYFLRDVKGATWVGQVTSLASEYDGSCEKVISKVKENKKRISVGLVQRDSFVNSAVYSSGVEELFFTSRNKLHYVVKVEDDGVWGKHHFACGLSGKTGGVSSHYTSIDTWCDKCKSFYFDLVDKKLAKNCIF